MTIMTFLKRATGVSPTPFLNDIEELMERADAAIRKLRLEAHRPDTGIADLLPGEPRRMVQAIESVVEQYLRRYTETKNNLHSGVTGPATAEAKSLRDDDAKKWEWHYMQRDAADMLILGMGEKNVDAYDTMGRQLQANPELNDEKARSSFRNNLRRVRARPYLDLLAGTWQAVYETFGISENPVLLAQLCARAAAERRGWHRLPQEHLGEMLNADGMYQEGEYLGSEAFRFLVGEEWFEDRHGNETETTATPSAAETGEIREQQMIVSERRALAEIMAIAGARASGEEVMPDAAPRTEELTAIMRRSRTSRESGNSGSVDPDDIGAAIDEAERGETVRATVIEPARVQPVVFENLTIYNPNGTPFRTYPRAILDGQISGTSRMQAGWIQHYAGTRQQLMSFPVLYAIIEDLVRSGNSAKEGLLADLRAYWIATSTQPDYGRRVMIHDAGREPFEFPCPFPEKGAWTRDLNEDGQQTIKALLMPRDLASALQTLQTFNNVPPYLWVPDSKGRRAIPERAAFANVDREGFVLYCGDHPGYDGRSRGVVLEYSASPPSSAGLLEF